MSRWVVILAGGVGSRFWPLSTPERPKQLLPLVGGQPLLRDTLDRVRPLADSAHTLILTNASLVPAIGALAPEIPPDHLIAEPRPAGTAAALAWAAHRIAAAEGADATMISVHADWAVTDAEGFRRALTRAADAAERHASLVTVGIVPSRPDPGFGYVQPAAEVAPGVRRVARFVEKPDAARAAEMCAEGYLWNSGIFVWRVGDYLAELRGPHARGGAGAGGPRPGPGGVLRAGAADLGGRGRDGAERARADGGRRFRVGRYRGVGGAAPRAPPRRAGQRDGRRRVRRGGPRQRGARGHRHRGALRRAGSRRGHARRADARDDGGEVPRPQGAAGPASRRASGISRERSLSL